MEATEPGCVSVNGDVVWRISADQRGSSAFHKRKVRIGIECVAAMHAVGAKLPKIAATGDRSLGCGWGESVICITGVVWSDVQFIYSKVDFSDCESRGFNVKVQF